MKERLDVLLVKLGYADSREKAKAILMAGGVFVNGQREDKAGASFEEENIQIEVRGGTPKYVSRGGLKLEKAMEAFPISLTDCICMDIGASTGGFTDCMLQNGAAKVYSVDVGHGQLAWKLRQDDRVICMEKTNFRYVQPADIEDRLDFASVDVSFISLTKILIPARNLLREGGYMVCLIKPQFEAGRDKVGKKGVVREPEIHEEVIEKIICYANITGFEVKGLTYSPIKGPEGNIEYLVCLEKKERLSQDILSLTESEAEKALNDCLAASGGKPEEETQGRLIGETVKEAHQKLSPPERTRGDGHETFFPDYE
ncbi:MAG: TlyA family RNA methyltransferase [Blautia sp.]|nr:TlyA family RNA methyltransferase [Blautia sp.]